MTTEARIRYPTFTHWTDIEPWAWHEHNLSDYLRAHHGEPWDSANPQGVWAITASPKNRTTGANAIRINFTSEQDYIWFCLKWA